MEQDVGRTSGTKMNYKAVKVESNNKGDTAGSTDSAEALGLKLGAAIIPQN